MNSIKYESKFNLIKWILKLHVEKEQEYIEISEALIKDFQQDSDILGDVQKELFQFVELYLNEQLLLQKKEYNFLMRKRNRTILLFKKGYF